MAGVRQGSEDYITTLCDLKVVDTKPIRLRSRVFLNKQEYRRIDQGTHNGSGSQTVAKQVRRETAMQGSYEARSLEA